MAAGRTSGKDRYWRRVGLAGLVALGLLVRLPTLAEPLLEGAAGKQTHTAMVARNLYRGRTSWLRPTIDDIGPPGYFVKELPLLPVSVALLYNLNGGAHEWLGRAISATAWLAATPIVYHLVCGSLGARAGILAALWYLLAPLALVYSRAFMNDAPMVAASLAAIALLHRWRLEPSPRRAAEAGGAIGFALLLKPHAIFWLVPSAVVVCTGRSGDRSPPTARERAAIGVAIAAGIALAAPWYLHAAAIHARYPVPGATVVQGWFDAALLTRPELYAIIGDQTLSMVFTPAGALIAAWGAIFARRPWHLTERALLAWGAGVWLQCLVFGTRMFDEASRGSEYYQLAMVPAAGLLIARGLDSLAGALEHLRLARAALLGLLLALLATSTVRATIPALSPPSRYDRLLADCQAVRNVTQPDGTMLVVADRGGSVLYYCDRRGYTFSPMRRRAGYAWLPSMTSAPSDQFAQALASADYVYFPFPDMLADAPLLSRHLEREWQLIDLPGHQVKLYARPPSAAGVTSPGASP